MAVAATTGWARLRPRVSERLLSDIVERIVRQFHPKRIILFGSYAYGKPDINSDVDLLVIMESEDPLFPRIRQVADAADVPFLPMDVIVYTPAEIKERLDKEDHFIANILKRGRVLYERPE
ncbi:MAG TPA: nucleotidyltransferase domain-containing protein [Armatimonadota bacterium]|nr:nucleotidyltransferase domain-containing protein [Armatimonadota bacterium]